MVHSARGRGGSPSTWLAGVYERNALGEVWLSFTQVAFGVTRFASREQLSRSLGVECEGESFDFRDPDVVARVRQRAVLSEHLLNSRHAPGTLGFFIRHVPRLDGAHLLGFALPDDQRSIDALLGALVPLADASAARSFLHGVLDAERAHPSEPIDDTLARMLVGQPATPPEAEDEGERLSELEEAVDALADNISEDSCGYWNDYAGNTHFGLLTTSAWPLAREPAPRSRFMSTLHRLTMPV